jgi:hypothetical protein
LLVDENDVILWRLNVLEIIEDIVQQLVLHAENDILKIVFIKKNEILLED